MYTTPRIALAMFIIAFVGVVRGLWDPCIQNSQEGVGERRGWCERLILMPEEQAFFVLCVLSLPFKKADAFLGDHVGVLLALHNLRGPAAIPFISRDTCSDSIAKLFCACFCGGIAQLSRDTLQNGVSHRCACVKLSAGGGRVSRHFAGVLNSLRKYRAIWSIATIVSQYRAIWGH